MTLRRRWTLTTTWFTVSSAALVIAVGTYVNLNGATRGAYAWLHRSQQTSITAYNRQLASRLTDDAMALAAFKAITGALASEDHAALPHLIDTRWRWRRDADTWLVRFRDGTVSSGFAPCRDAAGVGAALQSHQGLFTVWCGGVPLAVVGASQTPKGTSLYVGHVLGENYVNALKRVTGAEVELWGPRGAIATTFETGGGHATPVTFDERGRLARGPGQFGSVVLRLPGSYDGFAQASRTSRQARPLATGKKSFRAFVLVASLDQQMGPNAPRLFLALPTETMTLGARYSALAMILSGLLVVASLAALAWRLVAAFTRPIAEVEQAARRVAEGRLDIPVPEQGDREVRSLARSFNEMIAALETEQRRAVQAEKMAAIGQLAGGVAHEINNPLSVILGFAQGLDRRVPQDDPLRLPVASIVREAMRCKALVQELLTFSRTGNRVMEPLDLGEVVRASLLLLEPWAKTRGVRIETRLDELPLLVANRTQLQQVIVNLGNNAIDAMTAEGVLTISTGRVDSDRVRLEVADTGTGIPEEQRSRVFEPFFTTKEPGKGTGLGLSLVYEIVSQHGGTIELESVVGRGTRITIDLPTRLADGSRIDDAPAPAPHTHARRLAS